MTEFDVGDRVAYLRTSRFEGELQIVRGTIRRLDDESKALVRLDATGEEVVFSLESLTHLPDQAS